MFVGFTCISRDRFSYVVVKSHTSSKLEMLTATLNTLFRLVYYKKS